MLLTLTLVAHALTPTQSGGRGVDSLAINAAFAATGGNVSTRGAFTAGSAAGNFRIIATSDSLADTASVTVTAPAAEISPGIAAAASAAPAGQSTPFGPFDVWSGSTPKPHTDSFTLVVGGVNAGSIIGRIGAVRSRGLRLLTNMTGGAHAKYKTDGVFDILKWEAAMSAYNTPAIKTVVAEAVADGTFLGNILMDEPANTSRENSWGPAGTMNKARVDSMAAYAKAIFPTLPMGVTLDYRVWNKRSFRVIDFQVSQYRHAKGSVSAYRAGALALGARDGHAIVFSMNILDGGIPGSTCPIPETGGAGTYGRNCRMTPEQLLDYGAVLGSAGCAFLLWRYDSAFMVQTENQQALDELAGRLAVDPAQSCRRL